MGAHKIAVIGGDGIGPEVIEAGCRVLASLAEVQGGLAFDFRRFDWGSTYYRRTGRMMPEDGLAQLADFDAIYFGAVGDPHLPDDVTLWGLRLAICQGFDQYANVRPSQAVARHRRAAPPGAGRRDRLGDRAREQRGRICRRRRPRPSRPADRGRHGRRGVHARRRCADRALRLRPGARPPAQAPDHRHQVERAASRHGAVGRGVQGGRSATIPT